MNQKKSKNSSPRIKVIQKIYNALMNPDAEIEFTKNQYKKFIKDVVTGTLERQDLIEGVLCLNISSKTAAKSIIFNNLSVFVKSIS